MLIALVLPATGVATLRAAHARTGKLLAFGAALLDFSVDLSGGVPQDCPPIAHYRVVLRDRAWLRQWCAAPGDRILPAAPLALLSTEPDERITAPSRHARITVAGIVFHDGWSDGQT